jgi:deoxycytidylate deaminase
VAQPQPKKIHRVVKADQPINVIKERSTDEIVIALCGAVGSGTSTIGRTICDIFKGYGYTTSTKKVTDFIVDEKPIAKGLSSFKRIKQLQDLGSELRIEHGADVLSQRIIWDIVHDRHQYWAKKQRKTVEEIDYQKTAKKSRRHVTIIDSIKNPGESELLRLVYGDMFFMFGVLCNDQLREERLTAMPMNRSEAHILMERDKMEAKKHGQQVLKTLKDADFFIRNNSTQNSTTNQPLDRFIQLLIGQNNITPTRDEFGMYIAESAARLSGCMSRQVGAAILSAEGDIISTGRNDVPTANGGLYMEGDNGIDDGRCFKQHGLECENDKRKKIIYNKVEVLLSQQFENIDDQDTQKIIKNNILCVINELKTNSEIKDLLEYSKAVHAEMDAITTAARMGNQSLRNATIYSTTFPCHHCARHIIASGIKTVYYIEPYEKSLAKELHKDSIDLDSQSATADKTKVIFLHFEGVAPKQYFALFTCNDRKKGGKLNRIDLNSHKPAISTYFDSFIDREAKVVEIIETNTNTTQTGGAA